jgi:hypothetical protein
VAANLRLELADQLGGRLPIPGAHPAEQVSERRFRPHEKPS